MCVRVCIFIMKNLLNFSYESAETMQAWKFTTTKAMNSSLAVELNTIF